MGGRELEALSAAVSRGMAARAGEEAMEHLAAARAALREAGASGEDVDRAIFGCEAAIARACGIGRPERRRPKPYREGWLIEVCEADGLELPVCVLESSRELADFLGCGIARARNTLWWCTKERCHKYVTQGGRRLKILLVPESRKAVMEAARSQGSRRMPRGMADAPSREGGGAAPEGGREGAEGRF